MTILVIHPFVVQTLNVITEFVHVSLSSKEIRIEDVVLNVFSILSVLETKPV